MYNSSIRESRFLAHSFCVEAKKGEVKTIQEDDEELLVILRYNPRVHYIFTYNYLKKDPR
jgi:hypothetical protein